MSCDTGGRQTDLAASTLENPTVSSTARSVASLTASVPEPFRTSTAVASDAWCALLGLRLRSLVLFGSVARGQATARSDVDLLLIAEDLPRSLVERRRPLLAAWSEARTRHALPAVEWNLVTKTPEEARYHSPLYLDIVEDGILLVDRGRFFETVLDAMRARMRELGSRRVFLDDGSWYWNLKPDFQFGEVVEI